MKTFELISQTGERLGWGPECHVKRIHGYTILLIPHLNLDYEPTTLLAAGKPYQKVLGFSKVTLDGETHAPLQVVAADFPFHQTTQPELKRLALVVSEKELDLKLSASLLRH